MNLFEAVKESIPTRAAAEHYGIEVKRNGMACCPFHDDKNPSMKVDERFHCFGCQADGDVIDFVGRLFNLSPKAAAEKLADDFGIQFDHRQFGRTPQRRPSVLAKLSAAQEYRKAESRCFQVLCDYFHLLEEWKEQFAPQSADDNWHPLFCEALQQTDYIEYLLDVLLSGAQKDREAVVREKGPVVEALEKRIAALRAGTESEIAMVKGTPAPTAQRRPKPAQIYDRAI